jgi:hypothetical protein
MKEQSFCFNSAFIVPRSSLLCAATSPLPQAVLDKTALSFVMHPFVLSFA